RALVGQGSVALCHPVIFELGFGARSPEEYTAMMARLFEYATMPTTDGDQRRALDIQAGLAVRSQHRAISLVDALVASVAESRGLTILHYDADFELIAAFTGQPQQWIVPRGAAD
ncbi:MAG TPA: PIN domain-containing protein, partial [Chloroflexota bacterium]|nr:PIN domain-containing protein [Chloroflexota bacterium]